MNRPSAPTSCYCNVLARQRGLDPVGSAGSFADAVVVETPLPWKPDIYQKAGKLPQEAIDLLQLWLKRYYEGVPYDHLTLMVAPDAAYSRPGFRRVMYYTRPSTPFARYDQREYLVPDERVGALLWALFEAPADLPQFKAYRVASDGVRDLMICTHGTVDVACAKFGYPLYRHLRRQHASDRLRVWRVSHFGGHVFAPTLLDLPTGHLWAYVEADQADQIAACAGSVAALSGHYRGWTGLDSGLLQTAEWAIWQREGWRWFEYPKQGTLLAQAVDGASPQWAEFRIDYAAPDGSGSYEARVELIEPVATELSTNDTTPYTYPQYRVARLEQRA